MTKRNVIFSKNHNRKLRLEKDIKRSFDKAAGIFHAKSERFLFSLETTKTCSSFEKKFLRTFSSTPRMQF